MVPNFSTGWLTVHLEKELANKLAHSPDQALDFLALSQHESSNKRNSQCRPLGNLKPLKTVACFFITLYTAFMTK